MFAIRLQISARDALMATEVLVRSGPGAIHFPALM
jgi:hypothetical protein